MKIKHPWRNEKPFDVSTASLLDGSHCENAWDRIERLEKIIAVLIDELKMTDQQKREMLSGRIGYYEFADEGDK